MKDIFCLTRNNRPIVASFDKEKLVKAMAECIENTFNDDELKVLDKTENTIAYHTGISYHTDRYEIEKVELI